MGEWSQLDVWHALVLNDPFVRHAVKEVDPLWKIPEQSDRDFFCRLQDAMTSIISTYQDIAMCFGLQITEAYHFAANNPRALSQHFYNRVYGEQD